MSIERDPNAPPSFDWDANTLGSLLKLHGRAALLGLTAGLVVGLAYVLLAPKQWEATVEVVLATDSSETAHSGIAEQLGGLASLAGVPTPVPQEQRTAVAVLRSNAFVSNFLRQTGALPLVQEDSRGIVARILGTRLVEQRAINNFRARLMRVEEDRRAGTTKLTIRSHDREAAARWANGMIESLNTSQRNLAIDESTSRIGYLDQQLKRATSVEVQRALYGIMERELKTIAIARTREAYVLRVIDPAVPALKRDTVAPNVLLALLTSAVTVSAFAVLASAVYKRGK